LNHHDEDFMSLQSRPHPFITSPISLMQFYRRNSPGRAPCGNTPWFSLPAAGKLWTLSWTPYLSFLTGFPRGRRHFAPTPGMSFSLPYSKALSPSKIFKKDGAARRGNRSSPLNFPLPKNFGRKFLVKLFSGSPLRVIVAWCAPYS